ncbi:MAG TPA: glycoside hydrolase family 99-like domain-containing protein [Planctomycetota bacterium]|jgi:hypothetical protein
MTRFTFCGVLVSAVCFVAANCLAEEPAAKPRAMVGAYYFDGWAGKHALAGNPNEPWAKDAPTHLTRRMLEEFPERTPIWGWRDDSLEVMEKQIDLAADAGISFFAFCWYWHPTKKEVAEDSKHICLDLFLKAKNSSRMKFCLLVANHAPFLIGEKWDLAAEYWMPYLTHKQHVTVDGKPLLVLFNPRDSSKAGLETLQAASKKAGLPGLTVAGCGGGDPKTGFTHKTFYNIVPGYAGGSQEHKYAELVEAHQKQWSGSATQPLIPEITAGWDKRPWEGPKGLNQKEGWYFPDRTPEAFAAYVSSAIEWMDKHPEQATKERMLLIYAWNELGEGGFIAPTKGDPEGKYLKAMKGAIAPAR